MQQFPKSRRVLHATEFKEIMDRGVKVVTPAFVLFGRGSSRSTLGLVVSKKCGPSVTRSRIKRLIREWFRLSGLANDGVAVVVLARPSAKSLTLSTVKIQMDRGYARLKASIPASSLTLAEMIKES